MGPWLKKPAKTSLGRPHQPSVPLLPWYQIHFQADEVRPVMPQLRDD